MVGTAMSVPADVGLNLDTRG